MSRYRLSLRLAHIKFPLSLFSVNDDKLDGIELCCHYVNMSAKLIFRERINHPDGYIQEMIIWEVPKPVVGSKHSYKYRLFFGLPGVRLIGYDNERPKGDHRHYEEKEEPYFFTDVKMLVADFLSDINAYLENSEESHD